MTIIIYSKTFNGWTCVIYNLRRWLKANTEHFGEQDNIDVLLLTPVSVELCPNALKIVFPVVEELRTKEKCLK